MSEDIAAQAAAWLAAADSHDIDWEAFTAWLEEDPRHRAEYDALALLSADIDAHATVIARLVEPPAPMVRPRRRLYLGVAAVLAVLLVAAVLPLLRGGAGQDIVYRAGATRDRSIALNDMRIELSPGSVLTAVGGDLDRLRLDGAGYFAVPHRPDRRLTITAGDYVVRDIGTRFEVVATRTSFHVAVAAGSLTVGSEVLDAPVTLGAGRSLTVVPTVGLADVDQVNPAAIASWRRGRLVYDNAPLALVAAEVSRYAGHPLAVDPALAGRPFSGALVIGNGSGLAGELAQAAGVRLEADRGSLRLAAARDN